MVTLHSIKNYFCKIATYFTAMMLLMATSPASATEVDAQLDRDSVPAGEGALLTLRISGTRAVEPVIPQVENLIIQPQGQSQQMQIINGRTSVSIHYTYAVGSHTPGDYQIPAIEINADGQKLATQPLKLKVLDSGAAKPPAGMPPNSTGTQNPNDESKEHSENRFGFLTVELANNDRKHVYVGEIAPVRIRAWIPADARANLRSGIQPEAKAFTLHNVSNRPDQSHEIRDGKKYLVVTWFGGISATKSGKYPASLSVNATVAVRDGKALKQRRRMGGPFDHSFFDNIFEDMNMPMVQKDVTLKSDDQEIEVRSLPQGGRPDNFTGAVGNFKFDDWAAASDWKTGEPQQIIARISGSGNFALMKHPDLSPSTDWKTYPGKEEFQPGDEASFSGNKTFQFSAVPRKSNSQELTLEFTFFDPTAEAYKTITSAPKKIQITGNDIVDENPISAPDPPKPEEKKEGSLIAQRSELSPPSTLTPLVSQPDFIRLLKTAAGLCLLGALLRWMRVRHDDPKRIARTQLEKATKSALQTAAKHADSANITGFFEAARLAIQHRLGAEWNQPAQAITLAEIQSRLPEDSPVVRFFIEADRLAYSGKNTGMVTTEWRNLLDDAMTSLTPHPRKK